MQDIPYRMAESDWEYAEPASGDILSVVKNGQFAFATGASGETNTLPAPQRAGVEILLNCRSHGGGDRVITASAAINQTGNTIMTFGATRDNILLRSIRISTTAFRWQVIHNDGVALS